MFKVTLTTFVFSLLIAFGTAQAEIQDEFVKENTQGVVEDVPSDSKAELAALKKGEVGPNVSGSSSDFDDYLNDQLFDTSDGNIELVDLDQDSKVVLGGGQDSPAGVALKVDFENSPLEQI